MENVMEATAAPAKCPPPEGTWIQITFTLDPVQYRTLWERAENERRTIPSCVRESVLGFLGEAKSTSRKSKVFAGQSAGDQL